MKNINSFQVSAPNTDNASRSLQLNLLNRQNFFGAMADALLNKETGVLSNIDQGIRNQNTNEMINEMKGLSNQDLQNIYDSGSNPYEYASRKLGTGFVYNPYDKNLTDAIQGRDKDFRTYATNAEASRLINMPEEEIEQLARQGKNISDLWNPEGKDYIEPLSVANNFILQEKFNNNVKNIKENVGKNNFNTFASWSDDDIFNNYAKGNGLLTQAQQYRDNFGNPFTQEQLASLEARENSVIGSKLKGLLDTYNTISPADREAQGIPNFASYLKSQNLPIEKFGSYIDAKGNFIVGDQILKDNQIASANTYKGFEANLNKMSEKDVYAIAQELAKTKPEEYSRIFKDKFGVQNLSPDDYQKAYKALQTKAKQWEPKAIYQGYVEMAREIGNDLDKGLAWLKDTKQYNLDGSAMSASDVTANKIKALKNSNPDFFEELEGNFIKQGSVRKNLIDALNSNKMSPSDKQQIIQNLGNKYAEYLTSKFGLHQDASKAIANEFVSQYTGQIRIKTFDNVVTNRTQAIQELSNLDGEDIAWGSINYDKGIYIPKWKKGSDKVGETLRGVLINSLSLDKNIKNFLKSNDPLAKTTLNFIADNFISHIKDKGANKILNGKAVSEMSEEDLKEILLNEDTARSLYGDLDLGISNEDIHTFIRGMQALQNSKNGTNIQPPESDKK